jgi:CBS-domain-containing membrane protein
MLTLKKLTVRDAYDFDPHPSFIVGPDEDFADVVQRFASFPELRGIFVADSEQRLLGVITRRDLLEWARVKIGSPAEILSSPKVENAIRLVNLMRASTVGQFMRPDSHRSAIKPDDSLAHALRVMVEMDLIVLPVVDEMDRIVGDLKLSELLAQAIPEDE